MSYVSLSYKKPKYGAYENEWLEGDGAVHIGLGSYRFIIKTTSE